MPKAGLSFFDESNSRYSELGDKLYEAQYQKLSVQLSVFQQALANFAKVHPQEIKSNERFRTKFTEMCLSVGVDPLAASISKKGKTDKSLWLKLLDDNNEEYYSELAVKLIEVCKHSLTINGGIISVKEVHKILTDANSPNSIVDLTEKDLLKTVELINVLDKNFNTFLIGNKIFIRSVPQELNPDQSRVFEVCEIIGYTSVRLLVDNFSWPRHRAQDVLDTMMSFGFLWVDDQGKEKTYWEPSWIDRLE